ncbi:hypothetical protein EW146_g2510 [Bondarzewia mesenterica]|uniref:Fe2OG dioxygenase domain-containing protein n=1 Tax=Bondarzewia mesenterica TaxID=1095465 RepID=A0A4S4M2Q8_9AGAM|nr:hypothetical protein EW146_g2510 [Bondarzewia mesenterica]
MARKNHIASAPSLRNSKSVEQSSAAFPDLSPKHNVPRRVLLEDQILLLDHVFTRKECSLFVRFIENQPLELTPPKKRGEADRLNHRLSITSISFAQRLFALLKPHFPDFPYPPSQKRPDASARPAHSLNSNIRLYKYTPSQHFGPHYDDWVRDSETGAKSEWTLLIYLTGVEDGVEGGETIFYVNNQRNSSEAIIAPLMRGTALLHRHGHECLLHEGSKVLSGIKYVLRSDVMFLG